ncbi:TetR/AcrR family transcriptional regulator C-terminal domain-containing protein [Actinomadura rudentiformis]|uniref:TetR/AcrR family transcriptional regulator C-terminal domain-containing protein n=1 Tax=Actinomadura rudentiformis TaxID=359158 RepID=UPI001CEF7E26|nr:TetR/AcrR family transcriptional regulator C-terminal domain-containing protein [Actinomadura rudentiformis]
MTKRQEAVVRAALEILEDKGVEAVSMRAIAERLGVRMNTVLWHAKTKAHLLELMADAIVGEASTQDLPAPWKERVHELARRYRAALLAHRDGAAVVTGTYAAKPATLRFADTMVKALLEGGLDAREAAWTCWTIVYFTLGLTQEEQAAPLPGDRRLAEAIATGDFPSLAKVLPRLEDASFDERFDHGLALMLRPL